MLTRIRGCVTSPGSGGGHRMCVRRRTPATASIVRTVDQWIGAAASCGRILVHRCHRAFNHQKNMHRQTWQVLTAAILASACASGGASVRPEAADRVVLVGADGSLMKQAANDNTRASFAATPARVWPALIAAYSDLGVLPTVVDRA